MKIVSRIILISTALFLPRAARGVNIWESTTGKNANDEAVTCNEAVGGCQFSDIGIVITNILKFLFAIAIPITVGMIAFGAIQMVISRGSPEKIKNARSTMIKAVVGLVIVLSSYLIVITVRKVLTTAAGAV